MRSSRSKRKNKVTAEARIAAENSSELAAAIAKTRRAAGLTQQEVAQAMGTKQTFIAQLESGRTSPSTRTLRKFADATRHALHVSFVQEAGVEPARKASHTMTDTLSRPEISTDRRHFLGGAFGLAGLLSIPGFMRSVSAQEATAAAEGIDDYVWTPPQWEDPILFEILESDESTTLVRTPDGEIEVPKNPQRLVALDFEYTDLVPLGIEEGYAGVLVPTAETSSNVVPSGEYSSHLESVLAGVPTMGIWSEIDIEEIIAADPDLVLGFGFGWGNRDEAYDVVSEAVPYVRSVLSSANYPVSSLEQFGALFGREDAAATLKAEFEELVSRGREAIAPFLEDKNVAVLILGSMDSATASPGYFAYSDGMSEGRKLLNTNSSAAHFRDLGMTPSSFIEILADEDDRSAQYYTLSFEQIGLLDADYIFLNAAEDLVEEFRNHPVVQTTAAGQAGNIISNHSAARGYGFGARKAEIRDIVSAITGETFE